MMNRRITSINLCVSLALLALVGCHRAPADLSTAPIASAHIGGAFKLTDQDGKTVTDQSFAGKFILTYFGYTSCPDACPTDLQHLMAGLAKFERDNPVDAAKLQPLFISVDPARDTPARLKVFTAAFHPRLLGLTGSPAQIAAVAHEYAAVYQIGPAAPNGQYLVDHSRTAILFGPQGQPIMIVSQDGSADKIATELATWVR